MPPFRRFIKDSAKRNGRHGSRKKAFAATRLAEPEVVTENGDAGAEGQVSDNNMNQDFDESSEDDEIPVSVVNPYNVLLKSLNTQSSMDQHRRKRRRMESSEEPKLATNGKDDHVQGEYDALNVDEEDVDEGQEGQEDEEEALTDIDEDIEDPVRKHLDIDDQRLNKAMEQVKEQAKEAERILFGDNFKAVAKGPSDCAARLLNSRSKPKPLLNSFNIKDKLREQTKKLYPGNVDGLTNSLMTPVLNLQDVLFCSRNSGNAQNLHRLICLHVLNYVLKTRDRILKNTAKLARIDFDEQGEHRDQGFTRPKVVILLPTRQACYNMVDSIVALYKPEQQENRKRFNESFSKKDDDISQDKPLDFRELFGGNDDDLFRIGIKFTRKTVKFFSQFYNSDIIFASPLGLRMAMKKKESKKEDHDFLSSIEIVIVDQADAMLQQNWEHVQHIFNHLNLQPKEHHGCDFSRVRNWYLDGNAKFLRQTIVLSSFLTPELNQVYNQHMSNIEGALKITPEAFEGSIVSLGLSVKQTFVRFDVTLPKNEPDARFKAFTTTMLPNLLKLTKAGAQGSHGILVFIPSYMDFLRVRNFMAQSTAAQDISFGTIFEYATSTHVARARSHFASGRHSVLLYSGRAHHFRRYKLKGVKRVFMYSLPDNPLFYTEVAGGYITRSVSEGLIGPGDTSIRSLFCKFDILKLERIVGSKRLSSILNDKNGETFEFV